MSIDALVLFMGIMGIVLKTLMDIEDGTIGKRG